MVTNKLKLFSLISLSYIMNSQSVLADSIIHTDPKDLRKTSISGGAFSATVFGSGMFLRINQYVTQKSSLYFDWYLFRDNSKSNSVGVTFDNDQSPKYFHIRTFGFEHTIFGVDKDADITIHLNSGLLGSVSGYQVTTSVGSYKRKALSINGGLIVMGGRQMYYQYSNYNRNNKYLTEIKTGDKVDITDANKDSYGTEIFTKTSVVSLELGLKFKSIIATGIETEEYGKRWTDRYNEYFFSFLLPVSSSFNDKVYKEGKLNTAYRIINTTSPKPGIRMGLNLRNCIRLGVHMGVEASYVPSVFGGNDLFLIGNLGININMGKLKLIKEQLPE